MATTYYVRVHIESPLTGYKSGNDVTKSLAGQTLNNSEDKITIANYFDAPEYQIEHVTFTDGTLWDSTMFNQIL